MKVGNYEVSWVNFGTFRLDGGAMFGSVPKNLWERRIKADQSNCIPMATRCLVIRGEGKLILVDLGCGNKWSEKENSIFAFHETESSALGFKSDEVTDIILTHLHFDHAGGISRYSAEGSLELSYPNANVFLQKANLNNALTPNLKEKASYLKENVDILQKAKLQLIDGDREILSGIVVHRIDGHTVGQQWVEIKDKTNPIFFPTDLIPTAHHVPLPFTMGYDMCAATVIKEKEHFLKRAVAENAIVVFEHDIDTAAGKIEQDGKGGWAVLLT